jgi:hypothetical protein
LRVQAAPMHRGFSYRAPHESTTIKVCTSQFEHRRNTAGTDAPPKPLVSIFVALLDSVAIAKVNSQIAHGLVVPSFRCKTRPVDRRLGVLANAKPEMAPGSFTFPPDKSSQPNVKQISTRESVQRAQQRWLPTHKYLPMGRGRRQRARQRLARTFGGVASSRAAPLFILNSKKKRVPTSAVLPTCVPATRARFSCLSVTRRERMSALVRRFSAEMRRGAQVREIPSDREQPRSPQRDRHPLVFVLVGRMGDLVYFCA